jgi:hypothetical protein
MARCECNHNRGEEMQYRGKVFRLEGLDITDPKKGNREVRRIMGIELSDPVKDSSQPCFLEKMAEEMFSDDCSVGQLSGPAAGRCGKCGMSVWMLFERVS